MYENAEQTLAAAYMIYQLDQRISYLDSTYQRHFIYQGCLLSSSSDPIQARVHAVEVFTAAVPRYELRTKQSIEFWHLFALMYLDWLCPVSRRQLIDFALIGI